MSLHARSLMRPSIMKILFISQYFYPEPFSNNDIARSLVARGHDVDVITCVPNYPDGAFYPGHSNTKNRHELWEGIRIFRARTIARGERSLTLILNYLCYPFAALLTIARCGKQDYSVSFTSMPSPIFQAIVAVVMKVVKGVPAAYWVQDIWPDSLINTIGIKNGLIKRGLLAFCAFLYKRADIVLVQSEAFRSKLEAMGVSSDRIVFFPNTAAEGFAPLSRDEVESNIAALLPPSSLRLMFAGNVGESQNLDIIVEAARRLRSKINAQWVIVGSGRDLQRLQNLTKVAGVSDIVFFTGRHPMKNMPSFYALADAMIISLKDTEIFRMTVPYKLQSYMKAGKPVIGSISGETRRIIEEAGIGFCAEADDIDEFCEKVLNFSNLNNEYKEIMKENSINYFNKNYSPEVTYNNLESILLKTSKLNQI
jgi:colanic acid biosynthesis glycosyl transferase WcaI